MKQKEIEQRNKLIAEFMINQKPTDDFAVAGQDRKGFDIYTDQRTIYFKFNELLFHKNWNWLMPVIEKILAHSFGDNGNAENFYQIQDFIPDINRTHKAVVGFIKWYNKNKINT